MKVNGLLLRRLNPCSFDVCVIAAFSLSPQPLARSRATVLRHTATLAVNEALQSAMLFAKSEFLPDLWTTALDEILTVRVVVDHELDDPLIKDSATMSLGETQDCCLDLRKPLS